jgi:hypothetical protein
MAAATPRFANRDNMEWASQPGDGVRAAAIRSDRSIGIDEKLSSSESTDDGFDALSRETYYGCDGSEGLYRSRI